MSTYYTGSASETIQKQAAADAAGQTFMTATGHGQIELATQVDSFAVLNCVTFPAGLGDDPQQPVFMCYEPKKITSAVGGTMGDMSFQSVNVTKRNISQVALPIPTGINVAYAQGWDQTDVNAVQGSIMQSAAFSGGANMMKDMATNNTDFKVKDAMGAAKDLWQGKVVTDELSGASGRAGGLSSGIGMDDISAIASGGMGAITGLLNKIPNIGISGNTVAGVALGTAGKLLGPAMSTAAGFSSFSQVMAHYQGPAFRNFNFTYTLRPLRIEDQQNIVKIVNFFKIASAPSQISNGLFRIYETPYVFKIAFFSREGPLADVNRIAHCACTNVSVSYGGDRFQTFSGTNSPVETNIALSFKEIELITRTEMEAGY